MEISPLTTFFSAPQAAEKSEPKDQKADSLCTKILNAVKRAIRSFVSAITCGKVKIFEAVQKPGEGGKGALTGGKLSIEKSLTKAMESAKIDESKFPLQLQAVAVISEIFAGMCADGERVGLTGAQDKDNNPVITFKLPASLAKNGNIVKAVMQTLSREFAAMADMKCDKGPALGVSDFDKAKDSIQITLREGTSESANYSFTPEKTLLELFNSLTILSDSRPVDFSEFKDMGSLGQVAALNAIIKVLEENRNALPYKLVAHIPENGQRHLFIVPRPPERGNEQLQQFVNHLLKQTWRVMQEYINPDPKKSAVLHFTYDDGRLVLDEKRVTDAGFKLKERVVYD